MVLKHLLVVSHRVVEFDQASVVVLQPAVTLSKQLLTCETQEASCTKFVITLELLTPKLIDSFSSLFIRDTNKHVSARSHHQADGAA